MFGLEPVLAAKHAQSPPFVHGACLHLLTARCGLWLLVERLKPQQVWMPSYLCGAMLSAVDPEKTRVRFFPVDYNLCLSSDDWVANVQAGDLVVFIDYFGFPCDGERAQQVKQRGAWVLEDACQALLTEEVGAVADFTVFSPRKFVGVPDGAVLTVGVNAGLVATALSPPPPEWCLKTLEAGILRREFDRYGGERRWFGLFQTIENGLPVGPYAMSEVARMLLLQAFNYEVIACRRRENYNWLADELGDLAVFPRIPAGVVPLGFPIRLPDRDHVRQALFAEDIYTPVHWATHGWVPREFEESHQLSKHILTLPCDQRYGCLEMERMAAVIRRSAP